MEIELDIPNLKHGVIDALEKGAVTSTIQRKLREICERHQQEAIREMQEFVGSVAVSAEAWNFGTSAKITIRIPDQKP